MGGFSLQRISAESDSLKNSFAIKTEKNENQVTFFTSNKVSKAYRGKSDDDKVDGLECAPALDVLEDDGWQGHKDEAAEQDEEQRGENADLRLADFPLLWGD